MLKKIIVADDSKTFLMYLGLLLRRMGFEIIPAQNGLEVLKLLKLSEADAVMLDVHMPDINGISVLKTIKDDKQLRNVPVMMVSIDSSTETRQKCKNLGCMDYLLKPIRIDRLYHSLQECFYLKSGTRRKHLRAVYREKIPVLSNGERKEFFSETLSEGGIYLRDQNPFQSGTEVELELNLNEKTLLLKGTVIYTRELLGELFKLPPGMAVEFRDPAPEDARLLKSYIENLIAKDILDDQKEPIIEK